MTTKLDTSSGKFIYRVKVDLNDLSKDNHITLWYYLKEKIRFLEQEYKVPIELVIDLKGRGRPEYLIN